MGFPSSWHPEVLKEHDVADPLPPVHDNGFAVLGPRRAKQGHKVLRKLNRHPTMGHVFLCTLDADCPPHVRMPRGMKLDEARSRDRVMKCPEP